MSAAQVPSFDSRVAMLLLEKELGAPWTSFFAELSPEPIAAASLGQVGCVQSSAARGFDKTLIKGGRHELCGDTSRFVLSSPEQVYKGRLKTGELVAVKVQRPHVVETVSVDLFIIRCGHVHNYASISNASV